MDKYKKFPAYFKTLLKEGKTSFPEGTRFKYDDFDGYRLIFRNKDDYSDTNKNDFLSHFERGIEYIGKNPINKLDATYYGISFFRSIEALKENTQLVRVKGKEKRIGKGLIKDKYGPEYTNEKKHVTLWLYEDTELDKFEII